MKKKRIPLEELRSMREDVDRDIVHFRTALETHGAEIKRLHAPESKRLLSTEGLRSKEQGLRAQTQPKLERIKKSIVDRLEGVWDHAELWDKEYILENSTFFPLYEGQPATAEAIQKAVNAELLETFRRGFAEARARDYSNQDLALKMEKAARGGDIALCAVLSQEARTRTLKGSLKGEERYAVDKAFKQLQMPDADEAGDIFQDLDDLVRESNALIDWFKDPNSFDAQNGEAIGRFNRKKREQRFVDFAEGPGREMESTTRAAEAVRRKWSRDPNARQPVPEMKANEADAKKPANGEKVIPLERPTETTPVVLPPAA